MRLDLCLQESCRGKNYLSKAIIDSKVKLKLKLALRA